MGAVPQIAAADAPSTSTNCRRDAIDLILDGRDLAADSPVDGRRATRGDGLDEIFDQRQVNVRRGRMRLDALATAGDDPQPAGVEIVASDRSARAEDVERVLAIGRAVRDRDGCAR